MQQDLSVHPPSASSESFTQLEELLLSHLCDWGKSESWPGCIEDGVVGIEEDVAVDVLGATANGLERTEAGTARSSTEVQKGGRDGGVVGGTDLEGQSWEGSRAWEGVASLGGVIRSARDLSVICFNSGIAHQDKGSSSVRDTGVARLGVDSRSNLVGGGWVLPESVRAINRGVLNGTRVLGGVDITEVIGAIGVVWEVSCEERGV